MSHLQVFPTYSIPIDVNSEDQNFIETKFIVLAWNQHNLIIFLCNVWDQHNLRQSFPVHRMGVQRVEQVTISI